MKDSMRNNTLTKRFLALFLTIALFVPFFSLNAEEEKVLNIFTWETYIDSETLQEFTDMTGIKVNYSTFNTNEEMVLKVVGTPGEYDIILASDYAINMLRKEDLLYKLDKDLIPNYKNIAEGYLSKYYDENNEYTIPYTAGTPLILYDPAVIDFEITGYEDLWDERLNDSIVMIDDARNIIGITLKTMGESFNTTDDELLKKAEEKLASLRPNIRSFNYDSPQFDLISGECPVGYIFTSFAMIALEERPDLKVVYPKEGLGFGIDSLVISKDAPHPKNAHKLLNYLLEPEIGARIAEKQYYMSPNAAAAEFMPDSLKNNPVINIPQDMLKEAEFIQDLGEYDSVYQSIWQRFKLL
jgi:spermidine/putrescine transport system substrate-binding protein